MISYGRYNIQRVIHQGLVYRKALVQGSKSVTFQKQKLCFMIVTPVGIFMFDFRKAEKSNAYILFNETDFKYTDTSIQQKQIFTFEVQTKSSHYQYQSHNFTEKEAWKKAIEEGKIKNKEEGINFMGMKKPSMKGMRAVSQPSLHSRTESTSSQETVEPTISYHCIVTVLLQEAKDLPAADASMTGGSSDPYWFCIHDLVMTSSIKQTTLEPKWNEEFKFEVEELPASLLLIMYDRDKTSSDDLLGYIPLTIPSAGERSDFNGEWFELRSGKLFEKGQGKVKLSIKCRYDKETQDKVTFGVHLNDLISRPSHQDCIVPDVLYKCIKFLSNRAPNTKGIFRVPGSNDRMNYFVKKFDSCGVIVDFEKNEDVHLVASMLKLYLRELPEPAIPYSLFDDFIKAVGTPATPGASIIKKAQSVEQQKEQIITSFRGIMQRMPAINVRVLKITCYLLWKITQNSNITLMKVSNLAIVFSAVLLSPPPTSQVTKSEVLSQLPLLNSVVENLIQHYFAIFEVQADENPIKEMIQKSNKVSNAVDTSITEEEGISSNSSQGDESTAMMLSSNSNSPVPNSNTTNLEASPSRGTNWNIIQQIAAKGMEQHQTVSSVPTTNVAQQ